jgi:thioredoxin reductase (NADPH)
MGSYDLIIIGGGPAGLTAGIYTGRAQLRVMMIERLMPGGQVASTEWVENYPGFENGISGFDLMQNMEKQARKFGLEIISGKVDDVRLNENPKKVVVNENEYDAKTVIIATGSDPRLLNVPGEKKFKGRGVSYCATCDGPFFKDKNVVVVGGGSSGLQESIYLSRFVKSIRLIEIMPALNAEKILQKRARENPKFSFYLSHEVLSINGQQKVESVSVLDRSSGKQTDIETDGVFIWVGLDPNTQFLKDKIELDKWGYVVTDRNMETSVPGVFAAGDVCSKTIRQISTAVGEGTIAAEYVLKFIENLK